MFNKTLIAVGLAALLVACKPAAEPTPVAAPVEPAVAPVAEVVAPVTFQCGDERITASFDNTAGNVSLSIAGETLTLPQAVSGSGARYADEQGNEFWNKGTNATLTRAGKPAVECAETALASPWDDAKARGVAFRGIGQEPGWFVEVDQGQAPALRATLDNGSREVQVAQAQALPDNSDFSGKTTDGVTVELQIKREACADTMSGEEFAASAQLKVGDQSFSGCGRFLAE